MVTIWEAHIQNILTQNKVWILVYQIHRFSKKDRWKLLGLGATYVDITLLAVSEDRKTLFATTEKNFKRTTTEWDNMEFSGFQIETKEKEFQSIKAQDISKPMELCETDSYADFRSLRAKLAWCNKSKTESKLPCRQTCSRC